MLILECPQDKKLLTEVARAIKKGSLMFFLLGTPNYHYCLKEIERIGMIFITIVPNNEIRTYIYHKLERNKGAAKNNQNIDTMSNPY